MTADTKKKIVVWGQKERIIWAVAVSVTLLCVAGLEWAIERMDQAEYAWTEELFAKGKRERQAEVADTVHRLRSDGCRLVALDIKRHGTFVCRTMTRHERSDVTFAWQAVAEVEPK